MSLSQIRSMALRHMGDHGLLDAGWTFKWNNAGTALGKCDHRDHRILLSRKIFSLPANTHLAENTILHEIAHALVGPGHGHDHVWKRQARAIGCTAARCTALAEAPKSKYSGTCGCGIDFHKRSRLGRNRDGSIVNYSCGRCRRQVIWTFNQ